MNVIVLLAGGLTRKDVILDPIAALRTEHGLAPDPELTRLNGQLVIMPAPPSLRDPRYPLPPGTFWCAPGTRVPRRAHRVPSTVKPLIYFTLGTLDTYRDVFDRVLAALRDLPVRVVATVGRQLDPASFGPQPDHVRIEQFIPQDEILPEADLVIAHGIPSLLLPMGADQPHNTGRCVALGTALDPVTFAPDAAAHAVTALLHAASYRQAAQRIQAEINTLPEPADALPLIKALA